MSGDGGSRAEELLDRALALPPTRRVAFLEHACAGDPELRRELLDLLPYAESGPEDEADFLASPLPRARPGPARRRRWWWLRW